MSFAFARKKQPSIGNQRATSSQKHEQFAPNKSFDMKKGLTQKLVSSQSQQQLDGTKFNNCCGSIPSGASAIHTDDHSNRNANFTTQDQSLNVKMQKVFDRLGFLEDAISRVELQQDSMRPVLKMLETNPSFKNSSHIKKASNKENSSNCSSFLRDANGLLLDKLTKNNNCQSQTSLISQDSSSIIQANFLQGIHKEELERNFYSQIDQVKHEHSVLNKEMKEGFESMINQIEGVRQDILTMQEQQVSQVQLQTQRSPSSPRNYEETIKSFKAQMQDQFHYIKSKVDALVTKVDSMDNSYDKRISNLEAVVTPLIQDRITQQKVEELLELEFSTQLQTSIPTLIDEKVRILMQEKFSVLEKDIAQLKLKEQYVSNQGSTSHTHIQKLGSSFNTQTSITPAIVLEKPKPVHSVTSHTSNKSHTTQVMKKLTQTNTETKDHLEDLEQYILTTSETINEKLEEVHRQMTDLHSEIKANIELVNEKRKLNAADTQQFIKVLGEDVRQFISCMKEELEQVVVAIGDRDERCKIDMERIENKINQNEQAKNQINAKDANTNEKKEIQKVEAFKEHSRALKRHMENTSSYLSKEVSEVQQKIEEAKETMMTALGVNLYNELEYESAMEKDLIQKDIVEEEEFEDEDDGYEAHRSVQQFSRLQKCSEETEEDRVDTYESRNFGGVHTLSQQSHESSKSVKKASSTQQLHPHKYAQQPYQYSQQSQSPKYTQHIEIYDQESRINDLVQQQLEDDYGNEEEVSNHSSRMNSLIKDESEPHRAQRSPQSARGTAQPKHRYH